MTRTFNSSKCVICGTNLTKNGKTAAGKQRWKCPNCKATTTRQRPDVTKKNQLQQFLKWILGKQSQNEISGTQTGRSFRRQIAWCWEIKPLIPTTGEIHEVLQVDGFNLRTGWCVLVAHKQGQVVAYQWCARESQAAWEALFKRVPAPTAVVCDGGPGMHAALKTCWPNTQVQRCLVHLQRNIRKYVTKRSKTEAGRGLWGLALKLTKVRNASDAQAWTGVFLAWEAQFLHLTKERTYRKDTDEIPSWAKPGQKWWYTHQKLRSAHQVFTRVIKSGHLFTFLEPALKTLRIPSTTNGIEGGVNAQMRLLLLHHRGMIEEHQRRAIEWWLYMHSEHPDLTRVLKQHETRPRTINQRPVVREPEPGPALYDTGLDAAEGLWLRSGWAGRG